MFQMVRLPCLIGYSRAKFLTVLALSPKPHKERDETAPFLGLLPHIGVFLCRVYMCEGQGLRVSFVFPCSRSQ